MILKKYFNHVLPPLLEQKRIVTKIELVNSKIKG